MKSYLKKFLGYFGLIVLKKSTLEMYKVDVIGALCRLYSQNSLNEIEKNFLKLAHDELNQSDGKMYSQLGQDFFALSNVSTMEGGFYVEIGGGDPVKSSNSFLLQSKFHWNGIIVEPNPDLAQKIKLERDGKNSPLVIEKAIAEKTGYELFLKAGLLGTLSRFVDGDAHSRERKLNQKKEKLINIETISPTDFIHHHLPSNITVDFLSIDTEGAEWEIIRKWPFELIRPKAMVIEHNNRVWRSDLIDFCLNQGYVQVLEKITKFDAWFILPNDDFSIS